MPMLYRDFASQAQIDAQYNPGLALADPSAPGRHYVALAQQARATLAHQADVHYGATLAETLDIFPAPPAADGRLAPVFVFIHGGYWRALSSKEFSGVALGLNARGITTVVVNYALCPAVSIDEITRQCRAALAWVLRHIQQHGGDPTRVAVGGHSAGGHLGAMCLQTRWAEDYGLPSDPLAGALLISGLYDLAPLRYSYLQPAIQLDDGVIRRNSPIFAVRPCRTPLCLTWGGAETAEFARQSTTFHQAWLAAGNTGTLSAIAGADHYSVINGLALPDSTLCNWLADTLGAAD